MLKNEENYGTEEIGLVTSTLWDMSHQHTHGIMIQVQSQQIMSILPLVKDHLSSETTQRCGLFREVPLFVQTKTIKPIE